VVITKDYPHLAAHSVLSKLMDQFLSEVPLDKVKAANKDGDVQFPALQDYLNNYQDANEASSIAKIQQELDETKIILHDAIDSVCLTTTGTAVCEVLTFDRSYNVVRNSTIS
jgi:synaptobrevin family protein YKT6